MSWHSDNYGIRPGVVMAAMALLLALVLTVSIFAVRAERRECQACEKRGGSWQKNPDDCHLTCTVHGAGGSCIAWRRTCNNHCVMGR